jgi:hypothetical protein
MPPKSLHPACRVTLFASTTALLVLHVQHVDAQNPDRFDNRGQVIGAAEEVWKRQQRLPDRPAPRKADGRVSLGPFPGGTGLWLPYHAGNERLVNPENISEAQRAQFADRPKPSQVPFQPWARALHAYRRANQLEPHTRCKPSGGPRQFLTPYGVEFVELPEQQRILIVDVGGPHTFRTIYMDGRSHPDNLEPSYYGYSIGHWKGDTLVVDTRGFNEDFWIEKQGLPHTDRLHLIERFTRTDYKTMKYEVTIDDPGAYTRPWSAGFLLGWDEGEEVFEYICQENNLGDTLITGSRESIDRTSPIVP